MGTRDSDRLANVARTSVPHFATFGGSQTPSRRTVLRAASVFAAGAAAMTMMNGKVRHQA